MEAPPLPAESSPKINLLASALSKAQGALGQAELNAKNSFLQSRYADLTSVMEACREPLASNGLAVSQTFVPQELPGGASRTLLATTLLHESGQFLRGFLALLPASDAHALGSAITYARRYSLNSLLGICPEGEDDDGEEAMSEARKAKPRARAKKPTTKAAKEACLAIIAEVEGAEEWLRGLGIDPGNPNPTLRDKIVALGASGLVRKIEEKRKEEAAEAEAAKEEEVKP